MELIKIRNAHQGVPYLLDLMDHIGVVRDSRDGPVMKIPTPATIWYTQPRERVVFWPERDANPFFHLFESLWMLHGRRDVKFLEQFVSRMASYSDDGKNFHAAYGYRWRKHFKRDQLKEIIEALSNNKECRRQVLGIWDVRADLSKSGKDLPCNVNVTFQVNHNGELDMQVFNRSNDGMLGALGANAVQFSILQEYVAAGIGVPMGGYWQTSSNLHIYIRDFEKYKCLTIHAPDPYRTIQRCPYVTEEVTTTPIIDCDIKTWDEDLVMWMKNPKKVGLRSQFFLRVATPMLMSHRAYKKGDIEGALEIIQSQMLDKSDWKKASLEWLERRHERNKDGGTPEVTQGVT